MAIIDVNGQRIHYDDTGGGGPAVVFCHSFGMDGSMFAPQLDALADDYRCITWDQRAHGGSVTDRPFDFWDSASDCVALLDALRVQHAAVVGTSQGGFLALRAAIAQPERIAALAVLGSSAAAEDPEQKQAFEQLHDGFVGAEDGPPELVLAVMADICFGERFDAEPWKERWRHWPADQFRLAFRALVDRDDIVSRLPEVAAPTLVLHGTDDRSYAPSHGERICSGVARCEAFVEVSGGAHFLSITDPEPVNEALQPFLSEHLRNGSHG